MSIEVWFVSSDIDDDRVARLKGALTREEQVRADRFRLRDDRRRCIVSRSALRALLSRHISGDVVIVRTGQGKPRLARGEVEFSVSHSGDLVLLAISRMPVGIDVERISPLGEDMMRIARAHFSTEEVERVVHASDSNDAFYAVWCAKEAVVKALGDGLSADLRSFTVPTASEEFAEVRGLEKISLRRLTVPFDGYRAAVAAPAGEDWKITVRELPSNVLIPLPGS